MGLTNRNNPMSFEEMASEQDDVQVVETKVQPEVTVKTETKKLNWFQRLFVK